MATADALPPCTRCGAPRVATAPIYCPACGARQAQGIADPAAYRTLPERYDLVAQQPGHEGALAWRPRLSELREIGGAVVGVVIIGCLGLGWWTTSDVVDAPAWGRSIGAGICGLGLAICIVEVGRAIRRVLAPTRATVAVYMAEGAATGGSITAAAKFSVALRARAGETTRYRADHDVIADAAPGDIGIAYTQAERLLAFRWFDVMPPPLAPGELPRAPSCARCAAPRSFERRRDCAYCGEPLPAPDLGEHSAEFAAVAATPAAAAGMVRTVEGGLPSLVGPTLVVVLGAIGLALALRIDVAFYGAGSRSPYLLIPPAPFLVTLLLGGLWARARARDRGALGHAVAMILARRKTAAYEVNDRPIYRHYVTVAADTGARRELCMLPAVAARVPPSGFGVAHVRGRWLVGFDAIAGPGPGDAVKSVNAG